MRAPAMLVAALLSAAAAATACRDDAARLAPFATVVWSTDMDPERCWGVTHVRVPMHVEICRYVTPEEAVHTLKHELLHVAGLLTHPFDHEPCYNQPRSLVASREGPCAEEVAWLRRYGMRGIRLRTADPELEGYVREAAGFWNEEAGVLVFAAVNGRSPATSSH